VQLAITLFILFVLGIVGVYMLQVAKGIAYFVFLIAIGYAIFSFTQTKILGNNFQPLEQLIQWKDTWVGKSAEEAGKAVDESKNSGLSEKVTQGLKDVAGKTLEANKSGELPSATEVALRAAQEAQAVAEKHPGFFVRVGDFLGKIVRGVASLF
jgi:hypothetical protein